MPYVKELSHLSCITYAVPLAMAWSFLDSVHQKFHECEFVGFESRVMSVGPVEALSWAF